jgi:Tfp pilus assembly protein PilN
MRAVNLLPRDLEVVGSAGRTRLVLAAIGGVAAVTLLSGLLGMSASGQVDEQRASLELTEAAIARIPVKDRQPVAPDMSGERNNRIAALQSALSTRTPVDKVMTQLSYVVPEDVWLNGLTVTIPSDAAPTAPPAGQAPGATATAAAATVSVKGATYSQTSIARFLARLSALSSLENVRLTESSRVEPQSDSTEAPSGGAKAKPKKKQKVVVTFTVTADLNQGLIS